MGWKRKMEEAFKSCGLARLGDRFRLLAKIRLLRESKEIVKSENQTLNKEIISTDTDFDGGQEDEKFPSDNFSQNFEKHHNPNEELKDKNHLAESMNITLNNVNEGNQDQEDDNYPNDNFLENSGKLQSSIEEANTKIQETESQLNVENVEWWVGDQVCPACETGFVKRSKVTKCPSCKKFAHKRKTCLSLSHKGVLICTICKPLNKPKIVRGLNTFVCTKCEVIFAKKWNLYRHLNQKHPGESEDFALSL